MNNSPVIRDAIASALLLGLGACGGGGDSGSPTATASGPTFTVVETIAGQAGVRGGDDGTGVLATFNYPEGLAVTRPSYPTDTDVLLYIGGLNERIRLQVIDGHGNPVYTLLGLGTSGSVDGGPSTAQVRTPSAITIGNPGNDPSPSAYWTEADGSSTSLVRKVNGNSGATVNGVTVAGALGPAGSADGYGPTARFNRPKGTVYNPRTGELFVADSGNYTIRRLVFSGSTSTVSTIAGLALQNGTADGAGATARFFYPRGIGLDAQDNLYVADYYCVRKITPAPANQVTTLAGKCGMAGYVNATGDAARFDGAAGLAVDPATGDVYVSELNNQTIRKITKAGQVTTVAGIEKTTGSANGSLNVATFNAPASVAFFNNQLFIADTSNQVIRRIR